MENKDLMPIPQVLLFDCAEEVYKGLSDHRFSVKKATLGKDIKVEFDGERTVNVPVHWYVPSNVHEFEILIIDMCGVDEAIDLEDISKDYKSRLVYELHHPQDIFYTSSITSKHVFYKESKPEKGIYIVFEGDFISSYHQTFNLLDRSTSSDTGCTYDFFRNICNYSIQTQRKNGKRTVISGETRLSQLLTKYNDSFNYLVTFEHPTKYNAATKEAIKRDDFFPLVLNGSDEIVSFICLSDGDVILVLPQTDRKQELLIELLEDFFPEIVPEFFPESTKFLWLLDKRFSLPNTREFDERKQAVRGEYETRIKQIEEEIEENNKRFGFLHDLLKETDDLLVKAVIDWFKWLGFQNVIDVDQEKGSKQEDINIVEDQYVIIAEVKGIGGTSTDSDCSQISKHRRRLEKANKGKDIHPVFVVNHQRYISPDLRTNPPFTRDQIEYAEHDERGLVTTYQLFIWHNLIRTGIFSSDEVKVAFSEVGLISLIPPQYKHLGNIEEYFQIRNAFILNLDNTEIKVGEELLFEKGTEFQRAVIKSIQINGTEVANISNGEVGIVVSAQLGKGYKVYLCPN